MGFKITDEESFKAWGEDVESRLEATKDVLGLKGEIDKVFGEIEGIKADLGRRNVQIEGEQKRLPVSREDFQKSGMQVVRDFKVKAVDNGDGTFGAECSDERISEFQEVSDRLLLLSQVIDRNKYGGKLSNLKFYHSHYVPALTKVLAGLDTSTSGELSQFDPQEYGRTLYEKVRLVRMLPNLFSRVSVPRFPFFLPTFINDVVAGKWGENTAGATATQIADGNPSVGNAATLISSSILMNGSTLATQLAWSWELDEDSIIPMLPFLEMAVVHAIGNGQETALINGDATATHLDTDTAAGASTLAEKLWPGLRFQAGMGTGTGTAKLSSAGNKINSDANWREYVSAVRGLMGKYGVNSSDLVLIASPIGINQIRSVEAFRTIYAFGSQATNVTGGVPNPNGTFKPDGIETVVSEFMRENVDSTGVNTASGQTYTSLLLVNKKAYLMAEVRSIRTQVMNEVYANVGQRGLIASWRGDFKPIFPASGNHTGVVYGIPA